jgi:hypothetical protein
MEDAVRLILLAAFLVCGLATPAAAAQIDLVATLRAAIARCWNPPPGTKGSVRVMFSLNRNGTVAGQPAVSGGNSRLAAAAAQAILACAPYRLPVSSYSVWQNVSVVLSAQTSRGR